MVEIRAHAACLLGLLKCHRFNVRSACLRLTKWAKSVLRSSEAPVDQRAAVTPPGNLQQHSGDPSELLTPLRYTGAAQEAARFQKKGADAQLISVAVSLNHVRGGDVVKVGLLCLLIQDGIIDLVDFWRSCM